MNLLADSAVKFIKSYAQEIGFDSYREVEVAPNRIVCLMTYLGKSPEKASILLNSHTDVVPADDVNHQYNQTKLWYLRYIFKLDFGFFVEILEMWPVRGENVRQRRHLRSRHTGHEIGRNFVRVDLFFCYSNIKLAVIDLIKSGIWNRFVAWKSRTSDRNDPYMLRSYLVTKWII